MSRTTDTRRVGDVLTAALARRESFAAVLRMQQPAAAPGSEEGR